MLQSIARIRKSGVAVEAWIVGEGDRRLELERLSRRLGIAEAVGFLGRLDDLSLARQYQAAWALVLPSTTTEAFGLVTLEALHYGCPSVIPETIEAAESLGAEGAALTYSDADPAGLDAAISLIWGSPDLRARLAAGCLAAVGKYSWDASSRQISALILGAITGE
ncbi:MAG: glycosyltransferase [Thermoplasmata archaeon]|nr:glycosyltransferase [Thermoplasmata archaeon]